MAPGSHRQLSSRSDVRACHPLTTRAVGGWGGWMPELSPGRTLTHTSALSLVARCVLSNIHGAAAIVVSEYLRWRRLQAEGYASLVEALILGTLVHGRCVAQFAFIMIVTDTGLNYCEGIYLNTHICVHTLRGSMFTCIIVKRLSDSCSAKWLSCSGSCLCHLWALMRPRQERRVQPNEAAVTADEHC